MKIRLVVSTVLVCFFMLVGTCISSSGGPPLDIPSNGGPPTTARPNISNYKTTGKVVSMDVERMYEYTITGPSGGFILVETSHDMVTWNYLFTFIMKNDETFTLSIPMVEDKMFVRGSLPKVSR